MPNKARRDENSYIIDQRPNPSFRRNQLIPFESLVIWLLLAIAIASAFAISSLTDISSYAAKARSCPLPIGDGHFIAYPPASSYPVVHASTHPHTMAEDGPLQRGFTLYVTRLPTVAHLQPTSARRTRHRSLGGHQGELVAPGLTDPRAPRTSPSTPGTHHSGLSTSMRLISSTSTR